MTIEKPLKTGHVWLLNGCIHPVDLYVNYETEPSFTDLKPGEIGPIFTVDGSGERPYGVYTLTVTLAGDSPRNALASVSVDIRVGESYSAVVHQLPRTGFVLTDDEEFQISVYKNEFTSSAESRLTVRHCATAERLDWRLSPRAGENPEIPADVRTGALDASQWQVVTDIIENCYVFEVSSDGVTVARHDDLELEHEKMLAVYIIGAPAASSDPAALRDNLLVQEFQIPTGPANPEVTTVPESPYAIEDSNEPVNFTCEETDVWQTTPAAVRIAAVDPDGVVNRLSIARVDPDVGGIEIPDNGLIPSAGIGKPASAYVNIDSDVPSGEYRVRVVSNSDTIAQKESCDLRVNVLPITVERLQSLIQSAQTGSEIDNEFALKLEGRLDKVQRYLDDDAVGRACSELTKFIDVVEARAGDSITEAAAERISTEAGAMSGNLGCG